MESNPGEAPAVRVTSLTQYQIICKLCCTCMATLSKVIKSKNIQYLLVQWLVVLH